MKSEIYMRLRSQIYIGPSPHTPRIQPKKKKMLTKKYVDLALFLKGRDLWVELKFRASWRH